MTENTGTSAAGGNNNDISSGSTEKKPNKNRDSLRSFKYAIKTKVTEKGYLTRLGYFFDFLQIPLGHSLEDRATYFLEKVKVNSNGNGNSNDSPDLNWARDSLIDYISYLKDKVEDGEISGGTLRNYYAPIKLFYEQNDIELKWKKIERGLPEANTVANDRAMTLEEIRKLIEYPDRRIKMIVLVMCSSGIRVGAWENQIQTCSTYKGREDWANDYCSKAYCL